LKKTAETKLWFSRYPWFAWKF